MRKLRGRLMPPPGGKQPDSARDRRLRRLAGGQPRQARATEPEPGRVALHRLNRNEYANAVEDLLALDVDPATLLPADDAEDGFDNIANVLQVSPSFMDQYLARRATLRAQAVGNAAARPIGMQYFVRNSGAAVPRGRPAARHARRRGSSSTTSRATASTSSTSATSSRALWVYNMEFENTLIATLDGKKFFENDIGGGEDMKAIDQKRAPAVDAINARLKGIRSRRRPARTRSA